MLNNQFRAANSFASKSTLLRPRKSSLFHPNFDAFEGRIVMSSFATTPFVSTEMDSTSGISTYAVAYSVTSDSGVTDAYIQGSDYLTNITNNGTSGTSSTVMGVSMNNSGDFVVAWVNLNSSNLSLQGEEFERFNSSGTSLGSAYFVGQLFTTGTKFFSNVAMDDSEDVVITQNTNPTFDPNGCTIRGEEFNSSNSTSGYFTVTTSAAQHGDNNIAMDQASSGTTNAGAFVIAYTGADGSSNAVYADVFAPSDASNSTYVVASGSDTYYWPSVAMNENGDFAVSWVDSNSSGVTVQYAIRSYTDSSIGSGTAFTLPTSPVDYTVFGGSSIAINDSDAIDVSWNYALNSSSAAVFVESGGSGGTIDGSGEDYPGSNVAINDGGNCIFTYLQYNSTTDEYDVEVVY